MLNVLNYDMTDILLRMGINTEGGTFCFPEPKETDAGTKISILTQLKKNFNIPIDETISMRNSVSTNRPITSS